MRAQLLLSLTLLLSLVSSGCQAPSIPTTTPAATPLAPRTPPTKPVPTMTPQPIPTTMPPTEIKPTPQITPAVTPEPAEKPSPKPRPTTRPTSIPTPKTTPSPKPSPIPLALELAGWEAIDDVGHAALQVRFSVNRQTQLKLLNPNGEEVGTSPAVEAIERQVTITMGGTGRTPKPGTYQLYAKEGTRWVLTRELSFQGPQLSLKNVVLVSEPVARVRNQFSVRAVRFTLNNSGDLPAYLDRSMDLKILGSAFKFTLSGSTPRLAPRQEASFEGTGNASPFFSDFFPVELVLTVQSEPPVTATFSGGAGIP